MERGADGCLSFEDFNSIVSVLSAFSGSLLSVIQSFVSDMQVWTAFLVSSSCSRLHDLRFEDLNNLFLSCLRHPVFLVLDSVPRVIVMFWTT